MNRTQMILAGILLVQLLLILFVRSPFASTDDATESRMLLPALEAITPSRIELFGTDNATLTLSHESGTWVVEEAGGFPADEEKIESLLDDLSGLQVRRPVVSSSRYHSAFKVGDDENEGRVRVWADSSSDPDVDLILGNSPNYRITHVRRADDDRVYEARNLAAYDVRAAAGAWSIKQLVDVAQERVTEVTLTNTEGEFRLVRQDGAWSVAEPAGLADRAIDQEKLDALLSAACSLRMEDPVGPVDQTAQGLSAPAATVRLLLQPGTGDETSSQQVVVRVGGKVEDQDTQRYITRSGFGFSGTVWESSVNKLLEQSVNDLLSES